MILLKKPLSFKEYTVDAHIPLRLQRTARFPNILPFGVKWRMPASCLLPHSTVFVIDCWGVLKILLHRWPLGQVEAENQANLETFARSIAKLRVSGIPCCNRSCGKNQELQDSAACKSTYRLQALPCRWSATAGLNRLLLSAYVCIVEPVLIAQTENVETFWQEKPI